MICSLTFSFGNVDNETLISANYVELQHLFPGSVRLPATRKMIDRSDIGNIVVINKLLLKYVHSYRILNQNEAVT